MYSDADLIPDETQTELIMIRSRLTSDYFRIGDIANRLVLDSVKSKAKVTAGRIHEAVGNFVGKSERTVRYYAENAAFFDDDARCLYHFLPFSFFDFARNFGDQWEDVLKLAADNPARSLGWLEKNYLLHDDSLENKISEDSQSSRSAFLGLQRPVGGLEYGIWCAQNGLNANGKNSAVSYESPISAVAPSPVAGVTTAEFYFVKEVADLLDRANLALAVSKSDERVPEHLFKSLEYHLLGISTVLRDFAVCMDTPVKQAIYEVNIAN